MLNHAIVVRGHFFSHPAHPFKYIFRNSTLILMPFTGVQLAGFGAVSSMLGDLDPTGDDMDERLEKAARLVEADAARFAPVDTGRLKNSIHSRRVEAGKKWLVGSNVRYAPYQELGTSKMRAQSFLRPALKKNRAKIRAIASGFI